MNRKGFAPVIVLLIVAAVLVAGGIWYYEAHKAAVPYMSVLQTATTTPSVQATSTPIVAATAIEKSNQYTPAENIPTTTSNEIPSISIGYVKKSVLYPGFSWKPVIAGSSTAFINSIYVVPTSKAQGTQNGPSVVQSQSWEALVDASTSQSSNFDGYYSDIYNNYIASYGGDYPLDGSDQLQLGGYDFRPEAAAGVGGEIWGYLFVSGYYEVANPADFTKDTVQELTLEEDTVNADGSRCRTSCPYVNYVVSWSDPVTIGHVLDTASWNQ